MSTEYRRRGDLVKAAEFAPPDGAGRAARPLTYADPLVASVQELNLSSKRQVQLGLRHFQEGRLQPAARCFARAVEIDPEQAGGRGNLGLALPALGRIKEAIPHLEAVRRTLPQSEEFRAGLIRASILSRFLDERASAAGRLRQYHELRRTARVPKQAPPDPRGPAPAATPAEPSIPGRSAPGEPVDPAAIGEGVVVVSGLPRSGTSMLMQMLAAGGQPVLTDGLREADTDNPFGSLEYEPVKQLHRDAAWLKEAEGKAVKIVAPLLPHLPPGTSCHGIFIERDAGEILASQRQMLVRRGELASDSAGRVDRLQIEYARSVRQLKEVLTPRPRPRVLFLNHAEVLLDPEVTATAIDCFLGGGLGTAAMVAEVKPSLHRHRAGGAKPGLPDPPARNPK